MMRLVEVIDGVILGLKRFGETDGNDCPALGGSVPDRRFQALRTFRFLYPAIKPEPRIHEDKPGRTWPSVLFQRRAAFCAGSSKLSEKGQEFPAGYFGNCPMTALRTKELRRRIARRYGAVRAMEATGN